MSLNHQDQISHIQRQLKDCDRDHYLAAVFSGKAYMHPLWVLYAFNCELARISHVVQEPMLGKMRLQWWRDVIENAAGQAQEQETFLGHPVADQLSLVISRYQLDKDLLFKIVDARQADLNHDFFSSEMVFDDYHDAIWGNLYRLAAHIMTQEEGRDTGMALDHPVFTTAGYITGMIHFFRSARAETLILHERLCAHSSVENSADARQGMAAYKKQQIERISENYEQFLQQLTSLSEGEDRFFLSLALTQHYLEKWQKQESGWPEGFGEINPLRHFFTLWRAGKKGVRQHLTVSANDI